MQNNMFSVTIFKIESELSKWTEYVYYTPVFQIEPNIKIYSRTSIL